MPTGFAIYRSRTRPIALFAIWLVVLQTFLAGFATAQAGAMAAFDPLGAICHGSDGGSDGAAAADTTAPDANKVRHLCCGIAPPPRPPWRRPTR